MVQLARAADARTLADLVLDLAAADVSVRRHCLSVLKDKAAVPVAGAEGAVDAAEIMSIWGELEPGLSDLDEYGGGEYDTEDYVAELLRQIEEKLNAARMRIDREDRWELLHEVLPYISSSNAGLDDALYDVAYAACDDDEDLRTLAAEFEQMGRDWPRDHARRIYRRLGDREKYLELRRDRMQYGADYHDLATFYWDIGDERKALEVAREGMAKATGRMDELRAFMEEHARDANPS